MEVIEQTDATGAPVPQPGQGDKQQQGDTITMSKAEVESLRRERDEARQSERFWADRARSGQAIEPAAEPEDDNTSDFIDDVADPVVDGDTPEKLVDEFASQGVGALKKRGFITAADAHKLAVEVAAKVSRELIGRERQKMTSDHQIMTEFPDLKDQNSELFKETAKRYQRAVAMDPNAKKTPAALYLAAEGARESLKAKAPAPRPQGDDEPEDDRRQRAASQDARPRGRGDSEASDDMLGPEAMEVMRQMGITKEEYTASRKELVRPRGRR